MRSSSNASVGEPLFQSTAFFVHLTQGKLVTEIDNKLEDLDEQPDVSTPKSSDVNDGSVISEEPAMDASFMSESIYQKMPSPSSGRLKHKSISASFQLVGEGLFVG